MIYHLVNKRIEILAIATSNFARLCNWYNHVFALLNSMSRFNSINFIKLGLKLSSFCQTNTKCCSAGGKPPDPVTALPHCRFLATRLTVVSG